MKREVQVRRIAPDPKIAEYYTNPRGKSYRMGMDWTRDTRGRKYDADLLLHPYDGQSTDSLLPAKNSSQVLEYYYRLVDGVGDSEDE